MGILAAMSSRVTPDTLYANIVGVIKRTCLRKADPPSSDRRRRTSQASTELPQSHSNKLIKSGPQVLPRSRGISSCQFRGGFIHLRGHQPLTVQSSQFLRTTTSPNPSSTPLHLLYCLCSFQLKSFPSLKCYVASRPLQAF